MSSRQEISHEKTDGVICGHGSRDVDTAATAAAKAEVKEAGHDAADAGRDAAHATGTAMETAGKQIQRKTKKN
ncbi:MAG: hypothetical protein QOC81_3945 [Thermoanaerobaculia bacterium]|jgi:hypothetical protein|nr:hypothetical protein [Thermoanaerobaculia bacterium]